MNMQNTTEQAARWLEETRDGRASSEALLAWLKESPKHVEELLLTAAIEDALGDLGRRDVQGTLLQRLRASDSNVVPLSARTATDSTALVSRRRWAWRAAIAAGVVAIAVMTLFWILPNSQRVYATHIGEQRTLELEDGSIVYLNTDSKLKVEISASTRDLKLIEGEALFDVERDPTRPFRVFTGEAVIQAVGTQFNVQRRGDRTSVAVIEGRVDVLGERSLGAGEQAEVSAGGRIKQATADLGRITAWRQRRLVFRNDALADIAAEFNRYNRRHIIQVDPAVSQRQFTGTFNADAPESLGRALSEDSSLEVVDRKRVITVRAR